jgi:dUTP pyrophosphatase
MCNSSHEIQRVEKGQKVAQLVVTPYVQATFIEVDRAEFDQRNTARGDGGFGSTGLTVTVLDDTKGGGSYE